jgi:hypothetical protein
MEQFITKHREQVVGVLSGFDRIRFRGTTRVLATIRGLFSWLCEQGVLLKEFKPFALELTARLKASVEAAAAAGGRKIEYIMSSALSKEALVEELMRRERIEKGLVCVLSCVEPCWSYDINRDPVKKHIDLARALRKCLHWYLYYLHPVWGLCHIRIQSWLPFTVHVCVNGREWLCRSLSAAGIGFSRRDNCLTDVADVVIAQQHLDAQPWADWSGGLNALLYGACPALGEFKMQGVPLRYYWSADETEWATDVMFRSPAALEALYPSLARHAITTFGSTDVMRFLGRYTTQEGNVSANFHGEVVSDLRRRPEGLRVKHRVDANSIKMYDKQGSVLRVETTINDAHSFRVYRTSERDPDGPKSQRYLRKGVVDLPRRAEVSQAANQRYLAALEAVDSNVPLGKTLEDLAQPTLRNGHRCRGLHPLVGDDARLAQLMLRGEFAVNGFRNRDLRALQFSRTDDPMETRRRSARIGRLLRLFRDHGLIYRVRGTHRYQISAAGRRTLPAFSAARNADTAKLNELAA